MVSIKEFLEMYSPKKTIEGYTTALNHYFEFHAVSPDTYFDAYKNAETLKQRDEALDKIMMDVTRWLKSMETVGYERDGQMVPYASSTIQCRSGAIRAYLLVNRVDLGRAFWKKMKITGQALTQDRIPTKDELRKIVAHLDFLGRTFFYVQISTGLRIGDVLDLEERSFDFSHTPTRVRYYNKKIKKYCITFLTKEATLVVKEWINNREEQLNVIYHNAYKFTKHEISYEEFLKKQTNKHKLFPITDTGIYNRYNEALKKAGLNQRDEQTNIRVLHDHVLRKYAKTMLGRALPEAIADALIGHTGGLSSLKTVYNRHGDNIDSLAEDFLKAEGELSLTMEVISNKEIAEIQEQLENQDSKMKYFKQENEGLKALVSGLQQLIYGTDDKDLYIPAHLQGYMYGTRIGFPYATEDTYFSQEQFGKFLKSKEFLQSKQYKNFLKKVKKENKKEN